MHKFELRREGIKYNRARLKRVEYSKGDKKDYGLSTFRKFDDIQRIVGLELFANLSVKTDMTDSIWLH